MYLLRIPYPRNSNNNYYVSILITSDQLHEQTPHGTLVRWWCGIIGYLYRYLYILSAREKIERVESEEEEGRRVLQKKRQRTHSRESVCDTQEEVSQQPHTHIHIQQRRLCSSTEEDVFLVGLYAGSLTAILIRIWKVGFGLFIFNFEEGAKLVIAYVKAEVQVSV